MVFGITTKVFVSFTMVFAILTAVFVVFTMVFVILSLVFVTLTMVFGVEKIFLRLETIFPKAQTAVGTPEWLLVNGKLLFLYWSGGEKRDYLRSKRILKGSN
jgi:hypothetical protein